MCTVLKRRLKVGDIVVLYCTSTDTYHKGIVIEDDGTSVPYDIECPDLFIPLYSTKSGWLDIDGMCFNDSGQVAVRIVRDRDDYEE